MASALIGSALHSADAQSIKPQHRETNASREARIRRTIQETYSQRWEVAGGGGFLRFRNGENTKKNNEISWNTSTTYFLNPKLGVVASAQGSFGHGNQILPLVYPQIPNPQINEYFFMGGATYRFYRTEKFAMGGQVMAGAGWGIFSGGSKDIPSTALGLWPDETRAAFSAGVNLDYNFYPNLAFRVTPTYLPTTFGGSVQNNYGFNAGVVYRFGKQ